MNSESQLHLTPAPYVVLRMAEDVDRPLPQFSGALRVGEDEGHAGVDLHASLNRWRTIGLRP